MLLRCCNLTIVGKELTGLNITAAVPTATTWFPGIEYKTGLISEHWGFTPNFPTAGCYRYQKMGPLLPKLQKTPTMYLGHYSEHHPAQTNEQSFPIESYLQ